MPTWPPSGSMIAGRVGRRRVPKRRPAAPWSGGASEAESPRRTPPEAVSRATTMSGRYDEGWHACHHDCQDARGPRGIRGIKRWRRHTGLRNSSRPSKRWSDLSFHQSLFPLAGVGRRAPCRRDRRIASPHTEMINASPAGRHRSTVDRGGIMGWDPPCLLVERVASLRVSATSENISTPRQPQRLCPLWRTALALVVCIFVYSPALPAGLPSPQRASLLCLPQWHGSCFLPGAPTAKDTSTSRRNAQPTLRW